MIVWSAVSEAERRRRGAVQVTFLAVVTERRRRREDTFTEDAEPLDCAIRLLLPDFVCLPVLEITETGAPCEWTWRESRFLRAVALDLLLLEPLWNFSVLVSEMFSGAVEIWSR